MQCQQMASKWGGRKLMKVPVGGVHRVAIVVLLVCGVPRWVLQAPCLILTTLGGREGHHPI